MWFLCASRCRKVFEHDGLTHPLPNELESTALQLWDNQEEYKSVLHRKYAEAQK